MGGYYCESVFRTLLDFPVDLNEGDEFILCGLSNLAPPQENQTPASKIRIDDAYLQVQEKYDDKGELIIYKRETAARFKVWPIVVEKPGPDSTNDGSLIAGTYLMVYGVCGAQTPEKLTIKYSWTHEGTEYCVSEDIHNYPRARRPDTRLAELEFKNKAIRLLRGLRDAGRVDYEEERERDEEKDKVCGWRELLDAIASGTAERVQPSWCSVFEPTCPEQSTIWTR